MKDGVGECLCLATSLHTFMPSDEPNALWLPCASGLATKLSHSSESASNSTIAATTHPTSQRRRSTPILPADHDALIYINSRPPTGPMLQGPSR